MIDEGREYMSRENKEKHANHLLCKWSGLEVGTL